ncbi:GNAT family N-acetyltransferase [Paenibacillus mendelii]|uniref:GNAT family N-acetyltransferase n=1 Tax=Paenibacillus mendelii TaxID=206163 RepID=A0ABV6J4R7_9BACL|nr:GNAT family protein [Paenibacillus mendelii]MCQ6560449.1 GNAT family N-acetyltransferase [Paenibacillus mendelii]
MPRLYGDRIMLREYRSDDFVHMRDWVNDPEVVNNLSDVFLYPHTASETEAFLSAVLEKEGDHRGFVIADLKTEAYIGQIDLFKFDWKNRTTEMGIVIGSREMRDKGYGSEAIRVLQKFVFERLNLNRLQLEVHDYNAAAINCYIRCGFREEGRLRERHYMNGSYTDTVLMAILRSDYTRLMADPIDGERS